nr:DDE-type integrase/transposase/recombinase [Desulfopila sp. IMCC35006]
MDRLHMTDPSAGSHRMDKYLRRLTGKKIGRERVCRLMRLMGLVAVYPRKRTTIPGGLSGISPYRLRGLDINRPNQVVCADITHIPLRRGIMCLFAIIDWYSRKILVWELSNTFATEFCLKCKMV